MATTDFNGFRGAARRLEDIDIPRYAHALNVGEDELRAFIEVESRGSGYDALGRPKILFEPHVFYRCLPVAKRQRALEARLAHPKWGVIPYGKESAQYERLQQALEIDETAALKACSWGLSQVLGENHRIVGYDTVQDMIRGFMDSEEHHLRAMVNYIVASGIDDDLREHRWETVARVYNGPGYRKHGYHVRLSKTFKKWQGIPDVAWAPGGGDEVPLQRRRQQQKAPALDKAKVETIQARLRALGYFEVGKVDGAYGQNTRTAVFAFQTANGFVGDGICGPETERALFSDAAKRKPISPERAGTTVQDLRAQGSTEIKVADRTDTVGKVVGGTGVGTVLIGLIEGQGLGIFDWLERGRAVLGGIPPWVIIVAVVCMAAWWILTRNAERVRRARVEDERLGVTAGRPRPADEPCFTRSAA